ncbi:hypothetical protein OJ997_31015 [Solirubrobacter phytolaccae]|uniref:Uncharacterized protein n=1 Tax=Solirubrobacter phytolaccae TaxID=1404360 RepID=A0A9X3SAS2_9ACTN|nr:hypothetical protein [Solirubrobacter phytolaccae]MDA0184774.1 hypothetical protein [Solirubrobacter phytolaccae]
MVAGVLAAAVVVSGCESTQDKSARLERAAQAVKAEKGLVVAKDATEITVESSTVLQDPNGAAIVVELKNTSAGALVGLPIATTVEDAAAKPVYTNDTPGLDASLVSVPAIAGGESLVWVNDQVTLAGEGKTVVARVGVGGKPGPATLPAMEITGLKTAPDPGGGGLTVVGSVKNASALAQKRLVVFVVGRKDDKVVSAGRAIVEELAPGKSVNFSAFPIGDPTGAELSASAPPTVTQ